MLVINRLLNIYTLIYGYENKKYVYSDWITEIVYDGLWAMFMTYSFKYATVIERMEN